MPSHYGCVHQFLERGLETPECPICCEPFYTSSLSTRSTESSDDDDERETLVRIEACGHYFHRGCLLKWVVDEARNTCPTCRHELFRGEASHEEIAGAVTALTRTIGDMSERLMEFTHEDIERIGRHLPHAAVNILDMLHGVSHLPHGHHHHHMPQVMSVFGAPPSASGSSTPSQSDVNGSNDQRSGASSNANSSGPVSSNVSSPASPAAHTSNTIENQLPTRHTRNGASQLDDILQHLTHHHSFMAAIDMNTLETSFLDENDRRSRSTTPAPPMVPPNSPPSPSAGSVGGDAIDANTAAGSASGENEDTPALDG